MQTAQTDRSVAVVDVVTFVQVVVVIGGLIALLMLAVA